MLLAQSYAAMEVEILRSTTTTPTTTTTTTASCCSTLSTTSTTSAGSPCSVGTIRKARTPRKRPNQTYNEACALLSASYPNLFHYSPKSFSSSSSSSFALSFHSTIDDTNRHLVPSPPPRLSRAVLSSHRSDWPKSEPDSSDESESYFDAESLLDHHADRGIDSIMGDLQHASTYEQEQEVVIFRPTERIRALRRDFFEENWWLFPAVDMLELSPRLLCSNNNNNNKNSKPKKVKKVKKAKADEEEEEEEKGKMLKLNYDGVLRAWSGKAWPFSEDGIGNGNNNTDFVLVGPTLTTTTAKKPKSKKLNKL